MKRNMLHRKEQKQVNKPNCMQNQKLCTLVEIEKVSFLQKKVEKVSYMYK